jgi:hypothetical protein
LYKSELSFSRLRQEAAMTTLKFIAALFIALCIGATIGYAIAGLIANASKH